MYYKSVDRLGSDHVYAMGRKITDIVDENTLHGKRCFLIGGGISLKDFDYKILDNEFTIGMNRSFEYYRSSLLYIMDTPFYDSLMNGSMNNFVGYDIKDKWVKYHGHKVILAPNSQYNFGDDKVYFVRRMKEEVISEKVSYGIYPGNNSAFGALMLAIALGSRKIYLLGYDMKTDGVRTHYHSGYPNQSSSDMENKLKKFVLQFEKFVEPLAKKDVAVYNLNRRSALKCFDYANIKEVLSDKKYAYIQK